MTLALTLIALVVLALLVCAQCLYACSSHEDALRHIAAVHPRVGR